MQTIGGYAVRTTTRRSFEDAIARATKLLAEQGFGVLTEIDVKATLQQKLGLDTRPYRILGACNPKFAHRALEAEPHLGVLLPCNVVVWDEGDRRVVAAMEPAMIAQLVSQPEVAALAAEVSTKLRWVVENIG